jgi:hypothetical protein
MAALRPFCAVGTSVLSSELFERVVVDLDAIIALHENTSRDDDTLDSFTAGGSFWRPLADAALADEPVTAVDEVARYLAAHSPALRAMLCGATVGGYEWWWQEHLPDEAPKGCTRHRARRPQPLARERPRRPCSSSLRLTPTPPSASLRQAPYGQVRRTTASRGLLRARARRGAPARIVGALPDVRGRADRRL